MPWRVRKTSWSLGLLAVCPLAICSIASWQDLRREHIWLAFPSHFGSAFAQQFALVIHELATNAVKYGSLSTPRGSLVLTWDIEEGGDEPALRFCWKERGGPPAVAPVERGFGSELIANTLSRAPRISYDADGFMFAVEIPLSEVMRVPN
jgi:two-component sensor histidine kinase